MSELSSLSGNEMRALTAHELASVLALANAIGSDKERNQLLQDLKSCEVEEAAPDGSRLVFHIRGYRRPPYRGQDTFRGRDSFPVEGAVVDADGGEMDVLIFSDQNGRVLELELVKHMVGSVLGPDWTSFKVK